LFKLAWQWVSEAETKQANGGRGKNPTVKDLEKKREKALLKEFEEYRNTPGRKLKEFRLEQYYRDARCGSLMLPWSAEICLDRLGRHGIFPDDAA
jgi:hypothetical protein